MGQAEALLRAEVQALKRQRILTAAARLFHDLGYRGATLDAVAERLHVTKPFIYSYYDNKSALLAAICRQAIAHSLAAVDGAIASQGSATERLERVARGLSHVVFEHGISVALYFREQKNLAPAAATEMTEMRAALDTKLRALLRAGVASGEFQVGDIGLGALAIGGMISWMFLWYQPGGRLSEAEIADRMAEMVLRSVGAAPLARHQAA